MHSPCSCVFIRLLAVLLFSLLTCSFNREEKENVVLADTCTEDDSISTPQCLENADSGMLLSFYISAYRCVCTESTTIQGRHRAIL